MIRKQITINGKRYKKEITAKGVRHWYEKGSNGKWQYIHNAQLCAELDKQS